MTCLIVQVQQCLLISLYIIKTMQAAHQSTDLLPLQRCRSVVAVHPACSLPPPLQPQKRRSCLWKWPRLCGRFGHQSKIEGACHQRLRERACADTAEIKQHLTTNRILFLRCDKLCADLSVGPASDELHHPISIQVKGMDTHCMILWLKGERKEKHDEEKHGEGFYFRVWVSLLKAFKQWSQSTN